MKMMEKFSIINLMIVVVIDGWGLGEEWISFLFANLMDWLIYADSVN